jgi:type VI protein secretion system component Hcp
MRNQKAFFAAVLVLCAVPAFAAFQAHLTVKGTKQGQFKGEGTTQFLVSTFSWGVTHAPLANIPGCSTNEIHFQAAGDGAAFLVQACQRNEVLSEVTLDFGAEHHVLQNVAIRSCSNNLFTLHFDHCATHPATPMAASILSPVGGVRPSSPNAQLVLGQDVNIVGLKPQGNNTLVVRSRASLMQHCAAGQHYKEVVLTCRKAGGTQQEKYMVIKLTEVIVTSVQLMPDGSSQATLNFARSDTPVSSLQGMQ